MTAHEWVRFQVLMPQLEQQLKELEAVLASEPYRQMLVEPAAHVDAKPLPYNREASWRTEANRRVGEILKMMAAWKVLDDEFLVHHASWGDQCFFPYKSPKPDTSLRVTTKL